MTMQILPHGIGQAGSHRRLETESGDVDSCGRHYALQAGKSDSICMGDSRPAAGRRRLFVG